ncbi:MAG: hypothetical protein HGB32_05800 [Geobacteraceae bacterium]|nr:hypothetical protein [Geobacteraceae bacterium]NTW79644.1 hypothetical protein [Geobacteraceae bacterium]
MKKTSLLAALFIMTASSAMAQQWKHLGNDEVSTSYFYNPKTFSVSADSIISTWTKVEYNVDRAAMAKEKVSPDMYKGTKAVAAYEEFDCVKKKKRTITGMSIEKIKKVDLDKTDWIEVAKGSVDEKLLGLICLEKKPSK